MFRSSPQSIAFSFVVACCGAINAAETTESDADFFERKIRPLLHEHCYECHATDAKTIHGGLRLDSASAMKTGGDSGPAVVPGKPNESLLIQSVRYEHDDFQMPPKGKLPPSQIELLSQWVQQGAYFPQSTDAPTEKGPIDFEEARRFWSFVEFQRQPLPDTSDSQRSEGRIDRFVHAALQRQELQPSKQASRETLVRRITFDMTGLPPTVAEIEGFTSDERPDAYQRLVDRLMSSPEYGQRWGRQWLDLARYSDTTASWLYKAGRAYFYRDWVIDAINDDMPYDQFIRRQLATDMLEETGPEDHAALGFLGLSPSYWKELKLPMEIIKVIVADEWEERVDAVSRTFLGLTVACARCHDHKFDPITMEDYYGLAGVISNCRLTERPLVSDQEFEPVRIARERVESITTKLTALKKKKPKPEDEITKLEGEIESIRKSTAGYDMPMVGAISEETLHVVRAGKTMQDGTKLDWRKEPRDLNVFLRGNPNRPADVAPRRFLEVLARSDAQPYRDGSGRRELADSIVRDAHALVARVIVNRIWLGHFSRGIVDTPSNFGTTGERPSHPELLDDLAARFIRDGWSMKRLHREIVLSSTYRQASEHRGQAQEIDPGNRWLWRMNRSRLSVEAWRDAMLTVAGSLDRAFGGESQAVEAGTNNRRTVYSTIHRRDMSKMLQIHDFPDPTAHSPSRVPTTTALQGLYVLNSPRILKLAEQFVDRLHRAQPGSAQQRIALAYQWIYGRAPTGDEMSLGTQFVTSTDNNQIAWVQYAQALIGSNEFLFVD